MTPEERRRQQRADAGLAFLIACCAGVAAFGIGYVLGYSGWLR